MNPEPGADMSDEPTATLADARSPFLRHGAEQPVDWMPWGDAAFERARREDRPILLDIGAIWCHWCHVMDHESYEDPDTAGLINASYVPVKVDRDERPDVDARYQRAVQAVSGQGGWPLTAFLTPQGQAFYGGTYFPPEDRFGRPGFPRVLEQVARVWREERDEAVEMARSVSAQIAAYAQAESEPGEVSRALVDRSAAAFAEAFDEAHGGFGGAPKFPNAGALVLMLDRHRDAGDDDAGRILRGTLTAMGRGGIHDQIGGGFHRYATDARWLVPHFEKMAYDNGVLLGAYARAYAATGDAFFRDVADGIVDYFREAAPELVDAGGFPASQDADIGPDDDGDYWTWSRGEVREALGGDEELFEAARLHYGLDDSDATMPTDRSRHVLFLAMDASAVASRLEIAEDEAAERLAEVRRRLTAARGERPRPFVDETLYADWVALVASGHLAAGRYLGRDDATAAALRALDRIWDEGFDAEEGVRHRVGDAEVGGFLEDQAYVAQAMLDAYDAAQRPEYLDRARRVVDVMVERFRDPETGAFGDRPQGVAAPVGILATPHRPIVDSPTPAANAVAALALLRLAALLHDDDYRDQALLVLETFAGSAAKMPTAVATYARAVDWATAPVTTVVVVGDPDAADAAELLDVARSIYRPRTVVRGFEPGAVSEDELPPPLAAMLTGEAPRAYVCAGQVCAAPVADAGALEELLRTFRG